jgi:hypothetical protein
MAEKTTCGRGEDLAGPVFWWYGWYYFAMSEYSIGILGDRLPTIDVEFFGWKSPNQ